MGSRDDTPSVSHQAKWDLGESGVAPPREGIARRHAVSGALV